MYLNPESNFENSLNLLSQLNIKNGTNNIIAYLLPLFLLQFTIKIYL